MEIEKDHCLPFLDVMLERGDDGMITTSVYRKPTNTNKYLNFKSHHPIHVKRGVVKSLFDRARKVTNSSKELYQEQQHLHQILAGNGYSESIIRSGSIKSSAPAKGKSDNIDLDHKTPVLVIPYVSGLSENIRRVCRDFNILTSFKSGKTLRGHLTKVKDRMDIAMNSSIVYKIPCSCGRIYIGETIRRLEQRILEHKDACKKGDERKSAIAEHCWQNQHPILWNEVSIIDRAQGVKELRVKEAIHIYMTPQHQYFNRDVGLELPTCWKTILNKIVIASRSSGKGSSALGPT